MFKFADPEELLKNNIGSVNVTARVYKKDYAKKHGFESPIRYDAVSFLPHLYKLNEEDHGLTESGHKIINVLPMYFINNDMHSARYQLSTIPKELERVTCSAAIIRHAKKHNGQISLHFTLSYNDNFSLRNLTLKEISEMEKSLF